MQENTIRLLLAALGFNAALLGFIYNVTTQPDPLVLVLQISIPLAVWELLLFIALAPDEWLLELLDPLDDEAVHRFHYVIRGMGPDGNYEHLVRSSGDYSLRSPGNLFSTESRRETDGEEASRRSSVAAL